LASERTRGAIVVAGLALAALGPAAEARAGKRASASELAEAGIDDPRAAKMPRRHRFRLALLTDFVRTTQACNASMSHCQRFYFAPLVVDFAYQLQFLRYVMFRPSLGIGGNAGNTRNAMPAVVQPGLHAGYQGKIVGVAFGYSYVAVFPANANADNGRGGLGQPLLWNNHVVAGEVSVTTRIDRGALNLALRVGGMKTHLMHFDIDRVRWYPVVTFSAGWFFGPRRARDAAPSRGPAKPIE